VQVSAVITRNYSRFEVNFSPSGRDQSEGAGGGNPFFRSLVKAANLGSYSITDLTAGRELASCAFDSETYDNPDATQEAAGRHALVASRAIILIPKDPLQTGHQYRVKIQAGADYEWRFEVAGSGDDVTAQQMRTVQ